jgi:hypothetical protein
MVMRRHGLALALLNGPAIAANVQAQLDELRAEVQAMQRDYEARLRLLQERLDAAESSARTAEAQANGPAPVRSASSLLQLRENPPDDLWILDTGDDPHLLATTLS